MIYVLPLSQYALVAPPTFKPTQALKVLDTYCANVQRQGSGRIQNKAAYLMSLIQSSKLGPAAGTPGSAQRLIERLSPPVRRAVDAVFDPVVDRVVLEDRALMELLAKVPEEQVRYTSIHMTRVQHLSRQRQQRDLQRRKGGGVWTVLVRGVLLWMHGVLLTGLVAFLIECTPGLVTKTACVGTLSR